LRINKGESLEYHYQGRPGKIEVSVTKPLRTQRDLSLAYTPGVAEPVKEIATDPDAAYRYTSKGNLVAVISNGTAVLGLGNVGPLAGKPVMEGKGVLFKCFADIDAFDLEVDELDPDSFIKIVKALQPSFGGINLEDIKAPECFYIEEQLKKQMSIPVFHDDQHGTAIISGAALINALHLMGKSIDKVRLVINGAGAAALACADFFLQLGMEEENLLVCDSKGVIYQGGESENNPYKKRFARNTPARTLGQALKGADVFIGLSVAGALSTQDILGMAENPIIFALANPDPEINYEDALKTRPDAIIATGRSDYPNQVNNVMGFPFIFRGALDVRTTEINNAMKIAAAKALAALAREKVPEDVLKAYNLESLSFGKDYIIPKPIDPRVMLWVSPAVAQAAIDSGVARINLDMEEYKKSLSCRLEKMNFALD
jgi:malate dehydrogenase (oxaloacetate-decarboxylating)(NADP+)